MTPEPTPVCGIVSPSPLVFVPSAVIRTTAGLTFAATSMIADDSSSVTGWRAPTVVLLDGTVPTGVVARLSAPDASRARKVPPDARMAPSSAASMTWPNGDWRRVAVTVDVAGRAGSLVQDALWSQPVRLADASLAAEEGGHSGRGSEAGLYGRVSSHSGAEVSVAGGVAGWPGSPPKASGRGWSVMNLGLGGVRPARGGHRVARSS